MQAEFEPLSRRYDVVVANPPYMGSSNMNGWLSGWTKKRYKEVCKDLCTCFIKRGFSLSDDRGYEALITSDTCMYISSFEKMRKEVIERMSIVCFIDTRGTNAHPDVFDANAGWVLWNHPGANIKGSYFKLNHPIPEKSQRLLEALANPDCGWFYRCSADQFKIIPGSPLGYWVDKRIWKAYEDSPTFFQVGHPKVGMQTSNNDKYLKIWWEVRYTEFITSNENPIWIKYLKGGDFRKWYGNLEYLLHYKQDPSHILKQPHAKVLDLDYLKKPKCTWTDLTSGQPSFRYAPIDTFYDISGHCFFPSPDNQLYLLAYANTSLVAMLKKVFNSSFHFQCGDLAKIVVPLPDSLLKSRVEEIAFEQVSLSKTDWDSFEVSWDFGHHPLR